jgi:tetratricopeptide (TPR) repeat protein
MRFWVLAAMLLVAAPAFAQRLPAIEAERYERCMAMATSDPEAARAIAQRWFLDGGAHPAAHCEAVALIGLKEYPEAGKRLEALADGMTRAPAELRAEVLGQAGQAWLLAGDAARAHGLLTQALVLSPDNLDLLTDRAATAGLVGKNREAVADLDRVLAREPGRVDALTFRASAKRALGELDPALADIERAARIAPEAPEVLLERGNILRLKGDDKGAKRDWERVTKLAPASEAATAAKTNLARLKKG